MSPPYSALSTLDHVFRNIATQDCPTGSCGRGRAGSVPDVAEGEGLWVEDYAAVAACPVPTTWDGPVGF